MERWRFSKTAFDGSGPNVEGQPERKRSIFFFTVASDLNLDSLDPDPDAILSRTLKILRPSFSAGDVLGVEETADGVAGLDLGGTRCAAPSWVMQGSQCVPERSPHTLGSPSGEVRAKPAQVNHVTCDDPLSPDPTVSATYK
ncbi:unnamed protein product [Merluccius merluccius]